MKSFTSTVTITGQEHECTVFYRIIGSPTPVSVSVGDNTYAPHNWMKRLQEEATNHYESIIQEGI